MVWLTVSWRCGPRSVQSLPAVVLALLIGMVGAGTAPAADLQRMLDRHVRSEGLPGAVLLVSGPAGRQVVAAGVAERGSGRPVRTDHRFYIASVGKMMTAAAVLQLVEEGAAKLEAPVAPLLPEAARSLRIANLRAARLRHLLDHSSGIPDYLTDAFDRQSRRQPERRWTALDALAYAVDEEASFAPGEDSEYSNSNYVLLGLLLETVDRAPLSRVFERRIFARAGMTDSVVGVADPTDVRLAHGYADVDGAGRLSDVSALSWNSALGDGAITTTAADLERFAFALFRDGRLLGPAVLARMTAASRRDEAYGLGVERGTDDWGSYLGHTGRYDGFESELWYYPERQTAIVFLSNGHPRTDASLTTRVVAALFGG